MNIKINEALEAVQAQYKDLVEISDSILMKDCAEVDLIIDDVRLKCHSATLDQLRNWILDLQLFAYSLSEKKEKALFTADLAEAIQKEKFAISFNGKEGSQGVKDKLALIDTSEEIVSQLLYTLIANRLKTKVDQIHRGVDSLKSVLMSRMQETKFMQLGTSSEIPGTTNGKIILNE